MLDPALVQFPFYIIAQLSADTCNQYLHADPLIYDFPWPTA